MKRLIAFGLTILLASAESSLAAGNGSAAYSGGTIARFNAGGERIEGRLDTARAHQLLFIPSRDPHSAQPLTINYDAIVDLEFGQKVTRRVPLVAAATALLGPVGLLSLVSKSRAHFLTVAYKQDDGSIQVAIFEIAKDSVAAALAVVEARSGIEIEYQNEEARKWAGV